MRMLAIGCEASPHIFSASLVSGSQLIAPLVVILARDIHSDLFNVSEVRVEIALKCRLGNDQIMHGTAHRINERRFLLQRQHGLLAKGIHLILGDIIQAIVQGINPLSVRELIAQRDYRFEIVGQDMLQDSFARMSSRR